VNDERVHDDNDNVENAVSQITMDA
jgi:hypothetical protein